MSYYTEAEYAKYLAAFQKRNPHHWGRYDTPTQRDFLLAKCVEAQLLPSQTSVQLMIERLEKQGWLVRSDGGNANSDFARAVATIEAEPLTKAEIDWFGSLSRVELQDRYWDANGANRFRVRYDFACRTLGFVPPPKPTEVTA
jgi:hypothetical protein